MSGNGGDREYLLALDPELRRSSIAEAYPRRRLSGPLVAFMGALRLYVLCAIGLVVVTFVRALHH